MGGSGNLASQEQLLRSNILEVLEVPGFEGDGPDKRNIDIIKEICRGGGVDNRTRL